MTCNTRYPSVNNTTRVNGTCSYHLQHAVSVCIQNNTCERYLILYQLLHNYPAVYLLHHDMASCSIHGINMRQVSVDARHDMYILRIFTIMARHLFLQWHHCMLVLHQCTMTCVILSVESWHASCYIRTIVSKHTSSYQWTHNSNRISASIASWHAARHRWRSVSNDIYFNLSI